MKKRFVKKTATVIIAAFGFVAALAWNDAVQSLFSNYFGEINELWAKVIYALIVTLVAVVVTINIEKYQK